MIDGRSGQNYYTPLELHESLNKDMMLSGHRMEVFSKGHTSKTG
jgi:hypothetical protein